MKSLYQQKRFAQYWNERAGERGEIYKRLVLDPILFRLAGSLQKKTILELGCGNGYLSKKFIAHNPQAVILMDISQYNLDYARAKCLDHRLQYALQDATKRWKIMSRSVDIVYSNMMLNEVANIRTPIKESFRVLRRGGRFVFSVTHPCWDLYIFAQEKAGMQSKKILGLGNYFRRGYAQYSMGGDSKTNPALYNRYKKDFKVQHYQRPLSDYVNQLIDVGFVINTMIEPALSAQLLRQNPRFSEYSDFPIGLVFSCTKE